MKACADAGAAAGLVDLASLNLINAALAVGRADDAPGDWLVVHVAPDYATLAIVRDKRADLTSARASSKPKGTSPTSCTRRRCITRIG